MESWEGRGWCEGKIGLVLGREFLGMMLSARHGGEGGVNRCFVEAFLGRCKECFQLSLGGTGLVDCCLSIQCPVGGLGADVGELLARHLCLDVCARGCRGSQISQGDVKVFIIGQDLR